MFSSAGRAAGGSSLPKKVAVVGATGSGKSTIFSAMTFALFGEAARKEQHATSLRSDHADPDRLALLLAGREGIFYFHRGPEKWEGKQLGAASGRTRSARKNMLDNPIGDA